MTEAMDKAPPKAPAKPPRPRAQLRGEAQERRGGGARSLAELMPAVGDVAFRKFGFVQSALLTRWPEIVGDTIARSCQPESLRFPRGKKAEGVLRLTVSSAAAPMVQHLTGEITAAVNRFFGYAAVARVHLLHGVMRQAPPPTAPKARPRPPAPAPVAECATVRSIADPELRAVLQGLAASLAVRDGPDRLS